VQIASAVGAPGATNGQKNSWIFTDEGKFTGNNGVYNEKVPVHFRATLGDLGFAKKIMQHS
jgi:hypothetical protein